METIRRSVRIAAPVERVYDWLGDPQHLVEIWPSLVEVANVEPGPEGFRHFDWTYKMAGVRFHGHSRLVDAERPRLRITHNEEGIPSTFRWTHEARGDGATELTLEVEYEIPVPLLGRLAAPFIRRLNERELVTMLENARERLESEDVEVRPGTGATRGAEPPQPHA